MADDLNKKVEELQDEQLNEVAGGNGAEEGPSEEGLREAAKLIKSMLGRYNPWRS